MKKYVSTVILVLVFLAGGGLLLYPLVSDYWNSRHQSVALAGYEASVRHMDKTDYTEFLQAANDYNRSLTNRESRFHPTPEEDAYYRGLLRTKDSDVMASVEIPGIHVWLPVYHGTEDSVLQTGVGHVEGSSLPVGGSSTHCVLSGHRGLPSAKLFTDLNKMGEGDLFRIHILGMVLTYQVDQILVVEPQEMDGLAIEEGKDYCTLLTCTPYGINSHRLLVRGIRVDTEGRAEQHDGSDKPEGLPSAVSHQAVSDLSWLPYVSAVIVLSVLLVALLVPSGRKRGRRTGGEEDKEDDGDKIFKEK